MKSTNVCSTAGLLRASVSTIDGRVASPIRIASSARRTSVPSSLRDHRRNELVSIAIKLAILTQFVDVDVPVDLTLPLHQPFIDAGGARLVYLFLKLRAILGDLLGREGDGTVVRP